MVNLLAALGLDEGRQAADVPEVGFHVVDFGIDGDPVALAQCNANFQRVDRVEAQSSVEQGFLDVDIGRLDAFELETRDDQPR